MADKKLIDELLERNEPMPMGRFYFKSEEYKHEKPLDECGACEEIIINDWSFCPYCGQRIDHDNYKL